METVVSAIEESFSLSTVVTASYPGSSSPGQMGTCKSSEPQIKGLEVERRILREQRCSESVIDMLLRAKKSK